MSSCPTCRQPLALIHLEALCYAVAATRTTEFILRMQAIFTTVAWTQFLWRIHFSPSLLALPLA